MHYLEPQWHHQIVPHRYDLACMVVLGNLIIDCKLHNNTVFMQGTTMSLEYENVLYFAISRDVITKINIR